MTREIYISKMTISNMTISSTKKLLYAFQKSSDRPSVWIGESNMKHLFFYKITALKELQNNVFML